MASHVGLIIVEGSSKPAFELALDHYAKNLKRKGNLFSIHHLDELCNKEKPEFDDSYILRAKGYCNIKNAIQKVENSSKPLAKSIMLLTNKLGVEEALGINVDYIMIDMQPSDQPTFSSSSSTDQSTLPIPSSVEQPSNQSTSQTMCLIM